MMNPYKASAVAALAASVLAGGAVLASTGSATNAPTTTTTPPVTTINALRVAISQDSTGGLATLKRIDKMPLVASHGSVSDAGVVATTISGPGRHLVDVRIDSARSEICTGDRPDGDAIYGGWCAPLPIPIDKVPYSPSSPPAGGKLTINAVVPDSVNSFSATNQKGVTETVAPRNNCVFAVMPDDTPVSHVKWTTTSGDTYEQDVPEGGTQ